jgi:hypothetical protein
MPGPFRAALTLLVLLCLGTSASAQDPRLGWHEPDIKQGFQELQAGQFDQAVQTLDAALKRDPEKYVAWYYLGLAHHSAGHVDEALRAHLMAAHLAPVGNPLAYMATYNAACAHALSGRTERAFQALHRARNLGFGNVGLMNTDTDLDSLRADERMAVFTSNPSILPPDPRTRAESLTEQVQGGTGGVELGPDGTLYVADFGSQVWRLTADGQRSLLATGFTKAADCTLDGAGNLLQVDHGANRVVSIAPDGTQTDLGIAGLAGPVGIARAPDGTLFITNYNGHSVSRVAPGGEVSTLSQGGLLSGPNGVALSDEGGVFVVNYNDGALIAIAADGTQRLVADLPGDGNGHVAWSHGSLYVTDRRGHQVYAVTPVGVVRLVAGLGNAGIQDGPGATALFSLPNGIALDASGKHLYLNDTVQGGGRAFVVRRVVMP